MNEYKEYLANCQEYGGNPITEKEFYNILDEEKEVK